MGLATSADDAVLLEGRCSHRHGRRRPVPETGFSPVATRLTWRVEPRSGLPCREWSRPDPPLGAWLRSGSSRRGCELDGRGDDVLLTETGRRAYEKAAPAHLASIDRHFTGALSERQLDALIGIQQTIATARRAASIRV
jgi:hypothetical protein